MRLFKFLVVSNEVMEKSNMITPIVRVRINHQENKLDKVIIAKNKFYFYRKGLEKTDYNIVTQFNIKNSKSGIVLMSIDYPNEGKEFAEENKAYVIIDADNVDKVMELIAPEKYRDKKNFQGCYIKDCESCIESLKICKNKNLSVSINSHEKYIRGTTWNFANDTTGTKNDNFSETLDGVIFRRTIEPKTGGIVYSSLQWEDGKRPAKFHGKTIYVSLHHWVKCKSIPHPRKEEKDADYSFYHIGHTFDCRNKFIGLKTLESQKDLYKKNNPKYLIRRGRRVLAGQRYFSNSLECKKECFRSPKEKFCYISNTKCRDCEGALYINTKQGLVDLYSQLMSDEYKQLLGVDKTI
ncbi:hypothetical protein [Clostridium ljungdahlii]|uniref:Uncharacterized protein n=1 Tax=Clostridium ljungdahlii TaxID=1538 RepID=A0A168LQG9_9CLOT|nr:hypothetical protein [Clostridium ljungdahlii]OAA83555.1 hypothetical protein WY13_03342 [Clostridium ljungdahlii]